MQKSETKETESIDNDEKSETPCACDEPWCDTCAYQRECAVRDNPCSACGGSGLALKSETKETELIETEGVPMFVLKRLPNRDVRCVLFQEMPTEPQTVGIVLADAIRHCQKTYGWTESEVDEASVACVTEIGNPTSPVRSEPVQ